jgi:hypothetical protein
MPVTELKLFVFAGGCMVSSDPINAPLHVVGREKLTADAASGGFAHENTSPWESAWIDLGGEG